MLNQLTIKGFQRHRRLVIPLAKTVTIVGPSDIGKSAVIRALRWLTSNRPSGKAFIRHGNKSCSVKLKAGKHIIIRSRGQSNLYRLDDKRYAAFGNEVPADISKILNIGPINYQSQHDAPFWISKSPGEVSRELNAIINLGLIDRTLANVGTELRKAKAVVEVTRERLTAAKQTKRELAWVPQASKAFRSLEKAYVNFTQAQQKRIRLVEISQQVASYTKRLDSLTGARQVALLAYELAGRVLAASQLTERLLVIHKQWVGWVKDVKQLRLQLDQAKTELRKKLGGRCPMCKRKLPE